VTDNRSPRPVPSRRGSAFFLSGAVCAVAFCIGAVDVAPLSAAHAAAKSALNSRRAKTDLANKEPFGKIPEGPLQIVISIEQQKLYLYSDGTLVAKTAVATGVRGHPTPLGIFSIIEKDRYHRSNIYSNAPMPYMQRITWSGVALHEGTSLGHRASHGCIRMSRNFAVRLWALTKLGARVVIAGPELRPDEISDSHLFVHKEKPVAAPVALRTQSEPAKSTGGRKTAAVVKAADASGDAHLSATLQAAAGSVIAGNSTAATATVRRPEPNPARLAAGTADGAPDRLPEQPSTLPSKSARPRPITIFVSRKTKRLYVRRGFAPLFDTPVTIKNLKQPLGTHLFTALEYLADGSSFRWNLVSLPVPRSRGADRPATKNKLGRELRDVESPAAPAPSDAKEAIARIEIPQPAVERISRLIVPGSSLIISDQGLGSETGEETDFIVAFTPPPARHCHHCQHHTGPQSEWADYREPSFIVVWPYYWLYR
jgi:hypothetical protein